jgi:hypothetical protein
MIVRILNEGQWELSDDAMRELSSLDDAVEAAVTAGDQDELANALHSLLEQVRSSGTPVADEELLDSDLILPDADATLEEVQELLSGSDEGLVPN